LVFKVTASLILPGRFVKSLNNMSQIGSYLLFTQYLSEIQPNAGVVEDVQSLNIPARIPSVPREQPFRLTQKPVRPDRPMRGHLLRTRGWDVVVVRKHVQVRPVAPGRWQI